MNPNRRSSPDCPTTESKLPVRVGRSIGSLATLIVTVFLLGLSNISTAQTVSFQGIGDLPGGGFSSRARDVSADGLVVTGYGQSVNGREAFRWTTADGLVGLGDLPGELGFYSDGQGISLDGSTIVGESWSEESVEAYEWTEQSGIQGLGFLPTGFASWARGVSGNGLVVVGEGTPDSTFDHVAVRWVNGAIQSLGILPGNEHSAAYAASEDGSVVVGYSYNGATPAEAFRWAGGSMVGLGDFPGGSFSSHAWGVSANGEVIVGEGDNGNGSQAYVWTQDTGMVGVGPGTLNDISGDGTVAVGSSRFPDNDATMWSTEDGFRLIRDVLEDEGIDLGGWDLREAAAVSHDGTTIVGYGINPDGLQEGWIATFPRVSNWVNTLGGDFSDGLNWSSGVAPDASTVAVFDTSASYTVSIDENVATASLVVRENSVEFDITPEILYTVGSLTIDADVASTLDAALYVGNGTLMVDGDIVGAVVGDEGKGSLIVQDNGWLDVNESLSIGLSAGSEGEVSVLGAGARLTVQTDLVIGDEGTGNLTVSDAGLLISELGTVIGLAAGSNGDLLISGTGSEWISTDTVWIGSEGSGGLVVQNGGDVIVDFLELGAEATGIGSVQIDGAGSLLTVNSALGIGISGIGFLKLVNSGAADVNELLVGTLGSLDVSGGTMVLGGSPLDLQSKTQAVSHTVTQGVLTANSLYVMDGAEVIVDSVDVRSDAVVGGDGTIPFGFTNNGLVSPGTSDIPVAMLTIGNSYQQSSTGTLFIELDSAKHDTLTVSGTATLGGTLEVAAINDFAPGVGQTFDIITADSIAGSFDSFVGQQGLEVLIHYGAKDVTVEITQTVGISNDATEKSHDIVRQNYPNPSDGSTRVTYELERYSDVNLSIHDVTGKQMKYIGVGAQSAGVHEIDVDTSDLSAGIYFYTLTTADSRTTRKMLVVR